jgi:hypothetical protein
MGSGTKMIIPILHCEKQVQLKDLTRYDASKSILVKGSVDPINSVKIKAGADASEVEVFHANPKNWFLDFAFGEYDFDIDSTNSSLTFEAAGVLHTTNVTSGTYDLTALLTAVKSAMEAIASPLVVNFSVDEKKRITINPSITLKILPNTSSSDLLPHLGFKEDGQLISYPVEYGLRKVTLTVASISESNSLSEYVRVYTEEGDALFSEDADLVAYENDIMKWLPAGRGSFLDLHRRSQTLILDWMDRQGYRDDRQKKITKFAFIDNTDVNTWSTYLTLKLFFMSVQNQTDDVFKKKAEYYKSLEIEARDRAVLNLDLDGDGKEDLLKGPDIRSGRLFFR